MSDTTSPPSIHLHPLSPSSSMSSTDSAPQSEPTSDEQPDLGAFTTVLRAWTYLQPPPRIPVQIHSPTTSTTTTFQPDQSVVDSDFRTSSHAPPPPSSSSFTRPPSSSVLHEESTVWNHAPIASYLYSGTPSIERITDEDENSVGSTEGGRTVEINSELSFDEHSSSVPSQTPYPDVAVPVPLELPASDSSALISRLRTISRNSRHPVSYSSLLSYQIPDTPISIHEDDLLVPLFTVVSTETDSASLKAQRSSNANPNSLSTPTFCNPLALQQQQQHRTVSIHPPTQAISDVDDASVSHLSLPLLVDPPLPPIPTNPNPNPNPNPNSHPHPYLPQQQLPPTSLPQPSSLCIETSTPTSLFTRGIGGGGQGTIIVDDLRTPDQTPDSFLVDWKRGGRSGGFRPVDDDREEEVGEKRSRAYGYGLGFGFGRVQQIRGRGQGQKYVSGYTSNYEGSQSSFRARKSSEIRGRSTRLEPQNEDNEDSNFNSDVAEHQHDDEDQYRDEDEDEEGGGYPFLHYRRRGRCRSQTHTPRYYGRTQTPPRGVLPTQLPQQSTEQTQTQSPMEVLHGLAYPHTQPNVRSQPWADSPQQLYHDPHSYPDPYPRPHARPYAQDRDRDVYSSHSSRSPLSSLPSSPSYSHIELSPIQRDYVLIQAQTQLPVPMQLQSFSQQMQTQTQQTRSQPQTLSHAQAHPNSYLSPQSQGSSIHPSTTTTTALPPVPASVPASAVPVPVPVPSFAATVSIAPPAVSILPSAMPVPASSSYSNVYQGQGALTSQDHNDSPSSSSNKHGLPPPSSSSALLSKKIENVLKSDNVDNVGTTDKDDKPGKPSKLDKASWECVGLEGDELVPVSVSGSSSVGDGGDGGSGLVVESESGSGVGLGQPSSKVQQPLSTKQQQQRRQLELQFQQSDVQTRPHVESDSGGSEDRGGTTTAGASLLVSGIMTTTTTTVTPSTFTAISTTTESQLPGSNSHSFPDPDPNPNSNSHLRTNDDHPKRSRFHAYSHPQSDLRYHSHHPYSAFHSDSHVARMEDTTESELDLDLDDDLGDDGGGSDVGVGVGVGFSAGIVRQVAGGGSAGAGVDALLPSLGYLDEALSFIAAERVRWSAAREGGSAGAGGSGSGGAGEVPKGEGEKRTENWKVLDYDMDTPKRKRRRKRLPRWQQHVSSNSNSRSLEAPLPNATPLNASHTADEDGGPSTSTSSAKKKRARSSSWSPAKIKSGSNSKGKEKEFLIAPPLGSARPPRLPLPISVQGERNQLAGAGDAGAGVVSRSGSAELLFVKGQGFSKHDEDGGRTPTNGNGVVEDMFGPANAASVNLSGKRRKMGKNGRERERERMRRDLLIGKFIGKEVVGKVASHGHAVDVVKYEEDHDNESDNDDDEEDEDDYDDDDDDAVSHGNLSVEGDSSLNNLSILQPPSRRDSRLRKKGKDIAHIHSRTGIAGGGAYKSTPGSPKRRREFGDIPVGRGGGGHGHGHESLGDEDVEDHAGGGGGGVVRDIPDGSIGKKQTPTKQLKGLVRVRSVPQLRLDAEEPTLYAAEETITVTPGKLKSKKAKLKAAAVAPALNDSGGGDMALLDIDQSQTKRSRLIALAKKLREFFPEQRQELRRVTIQFGRQSMGPREKGKKAFLTSGRGGDNGGSAQLIPKSTPISVSGVRKLKRNIHYRAGGESASVDIDDDSFGGGGAADGDGIPEMEEDEDELDPRGRPPKKSDVLIHVFIDHSNILIGLLSHLRRFPLSHTGSKGTKQAHPRPTILGKATPTISMSHVTTPTLAFTAVKPTSTRPLPNPNSTSGNGKASTNTSSSAPIAVPGDYHHPIPLPSFATMSRSLPSGSVLNKYLVERNDGSQTEEKDIHSDSYEYHKGGDEDVDGLGQITSLAKAWKPKEKDKKPLKHLWHAALVLLLERGRSVTRRVIVTSSPLYQPMDGIERLGYELRVYVRVPDLGNGMDRDRRRDRSVSFSGGNKGSQSGPANTVSFSGLPLPAKKGKREMMGHVRRASGSTSAESGSGGGSGNASGGASNLHPYYGIANNTSPQGKIKYREQGVDELLQLKLHQALAATDDVPEGSTIVLATGDGNMGQFNEEGFLGPVRTALRRGWKVELYAWEDGLSRAWRREFGEGTEWGRKGMFRVIGMEQFASSLVEVIDQ